MEGIGFQAKSLGNINSRVDLQFYLGWLLVVLVVTETGRWISTGLAMQLLGERMVVHSIPGSMGL